MVEISENLRNLINADSRSFKTRLKYDKDTYEQIISLKRSVMFPSTSMSIGNALCACIECTAYDIPTSITGKKIEAEITIHESDEWIKLGSFTAQKPTVQNGNVTFTAYDAMEKASNQTYRSTLSEGVHTAGEYFEDICGVLNEPFIALNEASANLEIAEDRLNGYSCRDALAYLAGFLGKNCIVNRDGYFEMVSFKTVEYDMLNPDRIAEPELSDSDSIIGFLACCVDSETTLMSGEGSTGFEFVSPIVNQAHLDGLFNQMCGESSPVKAYKAGRITQILGDPTIDICDVISLSYGGENYIIPVMSLVFDYDGGLQAEIESFELAEPNSLSLAERLSFEQKYANEKTNGYINAMVEFSELIQKAYGVSNTVIDDITYFHDCETIAESKYIFCITGKGIAFTDSWGGSHNDTVWKYGIGKDGDAVLNMLKVFHIKADLIEAGKITSTDGKTYFNLNKGEVGTEDGNYVYHQSSDGVYVKSDAAVSYSEFYNNIINDEAEMDAIRELYKDVSNPIIRALKIILEIENRYIKRCKGLFCHYVDEENMVSYMLKLAGNKAVFSAFGDNVIETEYSAKGIKSIFPFRIDAPETDVAMTYYANTDNTFEDMLAEIWSTMTNTSYKQIQFYDKLGLYDNKFIGTLWRYTSNYGVLEAVSYSGLSARKCFYAGEWQPWEWINPPMVAGTEYRTTERYNNKPVHVKLVNCGNLPNKDMKEVATGVNGKYAFDMRFEIHQSGGQLVNEIYVSSGFNPITRMLLLAGGNLQIYTNADVSAYTAKVTIKYTKS